MCALELTGIKQPVKLRAEAKVRDGEQDLRARVIGTVDDGDRGKTKGRAELGTLRTTWEH